MIINETAPKEKMQSGFKENIKGADCVYLGIDIGSTTIKFAATEGGRLIYSCYDRHYSMVREKTEEIFSKLEELLSGKKIKLAISGSAGYGLAENARLPFVQEVFATSTLVSEKFPKTSAVIELGGEDAKVIFFGGSPDERMNGTCAGGTGAFIDQMATLLDITVDELDRLYYNHTRIYPIASRCGVFAKSDIQPLINQGAKKEDLAASIYQAVVNQTVSGLIQGSDINGKVMFLGGPLTFCSGLRERFKKTLKLSDEDIIFPECSTVSVALGASIYAEKTEQVFTFGELSEIFKKASSAPAELKTSKPLFANEAEYGEFLKKHSFETAKLLPLNEYNGNIYIGIDCGSTTTKIAAISEDCELLFSYYGSNKANPLDVVKGELLRLYGEKTDNAEIKAVCVTGYGEELIKNGFSADFGLVETMAHFYAAEYFNKDVDFIMDIGGQDMKCFKIRNKSIDSIILNEACSSGCGSFIETFARSLGYEVKEFAKLGLFAKNPVNLGSRCTVFMNSSVKQAQKDGATVADISAGLSQSVVKNAIYKVLRVNSPEELGKNIVVQGGTFLNDAILKSFEDELKTSVIRPDIAGLMGAFGAALYAKKNAGEKSSLMPLSELENFSHSSESLKCRGCGNNCSITVNKFSNGKKFISGNKCEKGAGLKLSSNLPNLFEFKRELLFSYKPQNPNGIKLGLPMALSMYELYPLWHAVFTKLGFNVINSGMSDRGIYLKGQATIPSDTVCYPAKLMHGHVIKLIEEGCDYIFYPSLTYNIDEKIGQNHYNCPVVAYYSELLDSNMKQLKKAKLLYPYLNINSEKQLTRGLFKELSGAFPELGIKRSQVKAAVKEGFREYKNYKSKVYAAAGNAIKYAEENGKRILVVAGRPYHIDMEICHSIDKLAQSLGFVILTEDSVSETGKRLSNLEVLNQWTFHSRMYNAADFVVKTPNAQLVQLVSFGCGIDAVTSDEIRRILEENGKFYTQLKIDEINNLGTVKIRLRSLLAAMQEKESR